MDKLYFSASGSITKRKAYSIPDKLIKLANEHISTTGPSNPGSILTYQKLERAVKKSKYTTEDVLKAALFRKWENA
jgi:hypothetical protein